MLVKFGYYDDNNHVKDLLPSIFKLLNGKEDYPTKRIKNSMEHGEDQSEYKKDWVSHLKYNGTMSYNKS